MTYFEQVLQNKQYLIYDLFQIRLNSSLLVNRLSMLLYILDLVDSRTGCFL